MSPGKGNILKSLQGSVGRRGEEGEKNKKMGGRGEANATHRTKQKKLKSKRLPTRKGGMGVMVGGENDSA